MFFKVGGDVDAVAGGKQRPEISISMYEPYALVPATAPAAVSPSATYPRFWFGDDEKDVCRYGNGPDQQAKIAGCLSSAAASAWPGRSALDSLKSPIL
jgi:hypothetical protein